MQVYNIRYWSTTEDHKAGDIHSTYTDPNEAKKVCRELGHTGQDHWNLKGYPPIAYVSTDEGCGEGVWYNPRFKKV